MAESVYNPLTLFKLLMDYLVPIERVDDIMRSSEWRRRMVWRACWIAAWVVVIVVYRFNHHVLLYLLIVFVVSASLQIFAAIEKQRTPAMRCECASLLVFGFVIFLNPLLCSPLVNSLTVAFGKLQLSVDPCGWIEGYGSPSLPVSMVWGELGSALAASFVIWYLRGYMLDRRAR